MRKTKIEILARNTSVDDLKKELCERCSDAPETIEFSMTKHRSIEPAVVIALLGTSGASLGALITGLLAIAKQKKSNVLKLSYKDGEKQMSMEIPVDLLKTEKKSELVDMLERLQNIGNSRIVF